MEKNQQTIDYFLSLPEAKKKQIVKKTFRIIRSVADKQLELLKQFKRTSTGKTQRHLFFFTTVFSFWREADFCTALGRNKYRVYTVYPARTMMEKALKILWFSKLKADDQDLITEKELLRQCFDFYQIDKEEEYKEHYNNINSSSKFPGIDTVKRHELKSFPSYEELCAKSGLRDANALYANYRWISGLPHGDLLSTFMVDSMDMEGEEYRRSLMIAVRFATEMIKIVDFHLQGATKNEVADALAKCDELTKAKP
jgi:hypothetical protein